MFTLNFSRRNTCGSVPGILGLMMFGTVITACSPDQTSFADVRPYVTADGASASAPLPADLPRRHAIGRHRASLSISGNTGPSALACAAALRTTREMLVKRSGAVPQDALDIFSRAERVFQKRARTAGQTAGVAAPAADVSNESLPDGSHGAAQRAMQCLASLG